jgi:D-serine dehydratase
MMEGCNMSSLSGGVSPLNKGLGFLDRALEPEEIAHKGWSLLHEDLSLPTAVLYQDKLKHNLGWMREFIAAYGMRLAPHGKTTMAPRLFEMQLRDGAWGITLATAHQTMVAHAHGAPRVLMANQLIGRENMAVIARLLQDPEFDYYCLVDSAAQAEQLGCYFSKSGQRLQVLLELGVKDGRTGIRNEEQLHALLAALAEWRETLLLRGIEMYEGVLEDETSIRAFLRRAVDLARRLDSEGRFPNTPILLSGAGSIWYDVVAEEFSAAKLGDKFQIVLRPGCYLTQDVGAYRQAQARILEHNPIARKMHEGLLPALQICAYVQSVPEPETAIITLGKRDAGFDSGLPVPALHFRPGEANPNDAPAHWTLTKLMDQHGFMQIAPGDDVRVGDMIGFDVRHPCTNFDKWRTLPILDSQFRVVDVVQTFF